MNRPKLLQLTVIGATIAGVSLLHYQTSTSHIMLHVLFQRGYYVPVLLAALWFGWRGGLLAAGIAGLLYAPHIIFAWGSYPAFSADQYVEIAMFFVLGALTGVLSDHEREQRAKVEQTAQKLSEVYAQLQSSFEQLRRADRLSALGELSAGLAHELRNPLGSIEGAVQILRRPELPNATRQEFGELAQKEVNRLKELVSNFLDFARPQTPRRKPTNVSELLESVKLLAADTANMSQVQICVDSSRKLPAVAIDPEQMKQVLLNLVLNAIQATPSGGRVLLGANQRGEFLDIFVRDEGIGIEPENLERIFDPFFTTRADGTGLGLSIAYQIVNAHGGHIAATRNAERGMTFAVSLPLAGTDTTLDLPSEQGT